MYPRKSSNGYTTFHNKYYLLVTATRYGVHTHRLGVKVMIISHSPQALPYPMYKIRTDSPVDSSAVCAVHRPQDRLNFMAH